jgi:ketosteroid isomerase-like protein
MPFKMKNGPTAMYGPKAMMNKKGATAKGVMDAQTEDMPVVDIEKGKAKGDKGSTAMMRKGASAMMMKKGASAMMEKGSTAMMKKGSTAMHKGPKAQSPAEHYAMNARHDLKTGEGSKKDIMYDIKKASEYGYNSSVKKSQPHKH